MKYIFYLLIHENNKTPRTGWVNPKTLLNNRPKVTKHNCNPKSQNMIVTQYNLHLT